MNVNVNVKMTNDLARQISGLGASLTLNFGNLSPLSENFLTNVFIFQQHSRPKTYKNIDIKKGYRYNGVSIMNSMCPNITTRLVTRY